MGERAPSRNHDQDTPAKSGEEMGERDPIAPKSGPETEERNTPLPEEETYEREHDERRPLPGARSVRTR
jgi:hypothetical protein